MPALFIGLSAMSIALGLVDLALTSPVAIRFEGVATNLLFAALFAGGSLRAKPLMQEFAEAARGPFAQEDAGRTRFFRAMGWLWAAYFVSRAGVCLMTALWLPLPQALAVRSAYALGTIVPMVAISMSGKRAFLALRRRGWFA